MVPRGRRESVRAASEAAVARRELWVLLVVLEALTLAGTGLWTPAGMKVVTSPQLKITPEKLVSFHSITVT